MTATTSLYTVRSGIAAYLGGTFTEDIRAYTGGPLSAKGLGAVRAGYPKELNMQDAFLGMAAGAMSASVMVVAIDDGTEVRRGIQGVPIQNGSGQIVSGGWKQILYPVLLDGFFWSHQLYGEDAEQDMDNLIEATKEQIRYDRTLGGLVTDAGETTRGLKHHKGHPEQDSKKRTGIWWTIEFDCRVEIIA